MIFLKSQRCGKGSDQHKETRGKDSSLPPFQKHYCTRVQIARVLPPPQSFASKVVKGPLQIYVFAALASQCRCLMGRWHPGKYCCMCIDGAAATEHTNQTGAQEPRPARHGGTDGEAASAGRVGGGESPGLRLHLRLCLRESQTQP